MTFFVRDFIDLGPKAFAFDCRINRHTAVVVYKSVRDCKVEEVTLSRYSILIFDSRESVSGETLSGGNIHGLDRKYWTYNYKGGYRFVFVYDPEFTEMRVEDRKGLRAWLFDPKRCENG